MKNLKWIHGPLVDLGAISFGWVPVFLVYLAVWHYWGANFTCDVLTRWACPPDIKSLIFIAISITSIHRHYALPFIYADRAEFDHHPKTYRWAPLVIFGIVIPACMYRMAPPGILQILLYATYTVVASISGVWNIYHVVMQKFGFLRIYAAKLGYGDVRLDRLLFFTWIALVVVIASRGYTYTLYDYLARRGFGWAFALLPATEIAGKVLLIPTAFYAAYITWQWMRMEWRHYTQASLPKLIFALSVALICLTFTQSLLLGYLLFGFSHALEYCVFANLYALRKYRGVESGPLMRFWARGRFVGPVLANVALICAVFALNRGLAYNPLWGLVLAYGLSSSLLHFFYDGLLWKMSNPVTREIVLDLR